MNKALKVETPFYFLNEDEMILAVFEAMKLNIGLFVSIAIFRLFERAHWADTREETKPSNHCLRLT